VNLRFRNAGQNQLVAVRRGHVEPHRRAQGRAAGGRRREEPPIDQVPFVSGRGEGIDELGADLVTASADARSDGRDEIGRTCGEFACQRVDGRDGRARRCSAPARVDRRHRARPAVGYQQRHAVGGAHGDGDIPGVRHDDIRLGTSVRNGLSRHDRHDGAAMHLGELHDARRPHRAGHVALARRRQLQLTRREEVRRHLLERTASKRGAPAFGRPVEGRGDGGKRHVGSAVAT
jgi:hypothetical protein